MASVWNAGSAVSAADKRNGFAWGGATAIRRDTFDGIDVRKYWWSALSDDLALTAAVRVAGLEIRFVPQAIVATPEDYSFAGTMEWTSRQMKLVRHYLPNLWVAALFLYGVSTLGMVWGILVGIAAGLLRVEPPLGSWLAVAQVPLLVLEGALVLVAARPTLDKTAAAGIRLWHAALVPLASIVASADLLLSLSSRTITWGGIVYEIVLDRYTIVRPSS